MADPSGLEASVTFRNLKAVVIEEIENDPDAFSEIRIDLKKFSRVLFADRIQCNDIIASKFFLAFFVFSS